MEDQEDKHTLVVEGTWHMDTLKHRHMCAQKAENVCALVNDSLFPL